MTDNIFIDIMICVLCSVLGGLIVGTLFEFNPYGPSKVRRYVLITIWLMVLIVAPVVVSSYIWKEAGFAFGLIGILTVGGIIFLVIMKARDDEEEEQRRK